MARCNEKESTLMRQEGRSMTCLKKGAEQLQTVASRAGGALRSSLAQSADPGHWGAEHASIVVAPLTAAAEDCSQHSQQQSTHSVGLLACSLTCCSLAQPEGAGRVAAVR